MPQRRIEYKMVEDRTKIGRSRELSVRVSRHLRVVRKDAGVVQQLAAVDGWLRDVQQTQKEKLQRLLSRAEQK